MFRAIQAIQGSSDGAQSIALRVPVQASDPPPSPSSEFRPQPVPCPQLKTQNSPLKTLRIQAIQGIQGSWDCFHWMLGVRCLSAVALAKVDWLLDVSPNCKYSLDAAAVGKQ